MAESGPGTAAPAKEGQSGNGSDPRSRAGGFGRPSLLRRLFDEIQSRLTADLDDRDPDFIRENLALSWLIASIWFRGEVRDLEKIPEEGPVLLVGNHSGGTITPDTIVFTLAFNTYFGVERPFYQLAHNLVLTSPVGPYLRRFGTVAASHENARKALDAGAAVLVYPGGDWEVNRPTWEANQIDFAGRRGFIKLALDAAVPIVPVVSVGGQETAVFLTHGERLAKLLRLRLARGARLAFEWKLDQPFHGDPQSRDLTCTDGSRSRCRRDEAPSTLNRHAGAVGSRSNESWVVLTTIRDLRCCRP